MPRVLAALTALAACLALAAPAAAAPAQTPAAYRAALNAVCRANTVQLKRYESAMSRAQAANDPRAYGMAIGSILVLSLKQDHLIRVTQVPPQLQAAMTTTNHLLAIADGVIVKLIGDAAAGRSQQMLTGFKTLQRMAPSVNRHLDAAGLRDCGSNQA